MKKVVHLTSAHPPDDIRIFHKECRTLAKAGYEVVLIVPHERDEVIEGVRIRAISKPRSRKERMTLTSWRIFVAALREDAELYHLHDPELLAWGKLLQILGKRVIFDMHENYPKAILTKHWINPAFRRVFASLYKLLEYFFLVKMPVIYAEKSYANYYPRVKRYSVLLNMPKTDDLMKLQATKYPINTVGYIGAVTPDRGSLVTLRSIQLLREEGYTVHWECIGKALKVHMTELIRFCKGNHLEGIRFRGYLSPIEGWRILLQCHIGLAVLQPKPNYMESYPTKMFEYMAIGLPVVVSNFPLYREIVEHYQCGLTVNPQEPTEVAQAIRWLIEHPEEAQAMGRRGQKAVYEHYNWNKEMEKLLDFYKNILYEASSI